MYYQRVLGNFHCVTTQKKSEKNYDFDTHLAQPCGFFQPNRLSNFMGFATLFLLVRLLFSWLRAELRVGCVPPRAGAVTIQWGGAWG